MIYKLKAEDIMWRLQHGLKEKCEDRVTTCLCLSELPTATGGILPNYCTLVSRFVDPENPRCTEYDWTRALLEVV